MRKKELFEQNTALHNRLQTLTAELKKYKELYSQNIAEINSLRQKLAEMEIEMTRVSTVEIKQQEEQVVNEPIVAIPELEGASQYGADVIGKIIVEGTKISNSFVGVSNDLSVELINLVLGKTEVCKAKIYDVCREELPIEQKCAMIDDVYNDCMDYFSSLKKQI